MSKENLHPPVSELYQHFNDLFNLGEQTSYNESEESRKITLESGESVLFYKTKIVEFPGNQSMGQIEVIPLSGALDLPTFSLSQKGLKTFTFPNVKYHVKNTNFKHITNPGWDPDLTKQKPEIITQLSQTLIAWINESIAEGKLDKSLIEVDIAT